MARRVVVDLVADASQFQRGIGQAQSKMRQFGQKMSRAGTQLTKFVTLPILGVGVASFKAASDLIESQSAVGVAFGRSAKDVQKWGKDLDSAYGFTQRGALDAAASFQLVTKNADFTTEQIQDLVERSADLGSVFNVDVVEAAAAMKSALVGETEPIRRLGVVMNAAAIEAKAVELGLIKVGDELPLAAKQAATYALIMDQTAFAQGDATRTADTAAGKLRTLKADAGRLAEDLGTKLIPIGVRLLDSLRGLVDWFGNLTDAQLDLILKVALVVAAIGPASKLIGAIANLSSVLALLAANPIALVAVGIGLIAIAAFALSRDIAIFGRDFEIFWNNLRIRVANIINAMIRDVQRAIGIDLLNILSPFRDIKLPQITVPVRVRFEGQPRGGQRPLQTGGIVPGFPGQAVPIMAHGGERIIRASEARQGGGGGPIILQLIVDKNQIAEWIVDPVRRQILELKARNVTAGLA